ncbi:TPA: hypothetical protein ACU9Y0_003261 [Enterobacter cloacae]|nr:hypothetical protein [Enterobacter cloacae]MCK6806766.1 hypothetical protein [Enterobacter cloacae]MCK6829706.1 hypothetical protein [Enterobacter cloacae]MCM7173309.1 hypothetical protein [Enterobacter cloacae]MDR9971457.1 hypothetical protein [Enterobacter cloacae subsp. cloacae]MDS0085669.1 hypothetical protein [Enterobacter cloacae subsp. cloacae]
MNCIAGVNASNAASVHDYPLATMHGDRYDAEASLCFSVDAGGVRHNVRE